MDLPPHLFQQLTFGLILAGGLYLFITEKLRVKEMGPADHIRTKHEVKAWLEASGDAREAEAIVIRARARRELHQTESVTRKLTQRQSQRQNMGD